MAGLFGHLNIADADRPFTIVQGQEVMYRETELIFQRWNADMEGALKLFVEETTENFKMRYKLPGNGYLQEEGPQSESAAVKANGSWDIALPLRQYGAAMSWDDVTLGYMSMKEFENHVQTVINQNNNTVFYLILKALFNNANVTFNDPIHGNLTCVPLANGDSVVYPPVFGSTTEATANFYLAPNYTEATISNTNNPFKTIRDTLEPYWGFPQGGSPIVALVNTSAVSYAKLLAGFDEFTNRYLMPGANITTLTDLPPEFQGGRIVGVCDGVVIVEWPRMPSGWMIGLHMDAPKPLKRRRDPADTGLNVGLQLKTRDEQYPFENARWRHRVGFGVGNRLNAVVVALNGTSSYSIPTAYQ